MRAAADTEIEVKVDGSIRTATCKKQGDMENGKSIAFTLRVVDLQRFEFLKMPIDSGAQKASVKRAFGRQSMKLQENDVIHSNTGMVWFIHDDDRHGHTPKGCPVVRRVLGFYGLLMIKPAAKSYMLLVPKT